MGAADLCAAGFGAPHIRQRLYFVANTEAGRRGECRDAALAGDGGHTDGGCGMVQSFGSRIGGGDQRGLGTPREEVQEQGDGARPPIEPRHGGEDAGVALGYTSGAGLEGHAGDGAGCVRQVGEVSEPDRSTGAADLPCGMADTDGRDPGAEGVQRGGEHGLQPEDRGPCNGFWRNAAWIPCRDGKARPVEPIAQQMADGSTESLGRGHHNCIVEIEKEILNVYPSEGDARKAVSDLREVISEEAIRYPPRRRSGVHEAPILLAFLRQLSDQGWAFAEGVPCTGEETPETRVRGLRINVPPSCTPRQRGLERQSAGEHPDAVRILSPILARHAQEAWGEAFDANARATFPLITGATARVGRLHLYGNCIVAPVAEAFVKAYMEIKGW